MEQVKGKAGLRVASLNSETICERYGKVVETLGRWTDVFACKQQDGRGRQEYELLDGLCPQARDCRGHK